LSPAPSIDARVYELGNPILGLCYGAAGSNGSSSSAAPSTRTGQASYGRTELTQTGPSPTQHGLAGDIERLDEPRRPHHRRARRVRRGPPPAPARRWRPCTIPSAGSSGCSSTRGGAHLTAGSEVFDHFLIDVVRLPARLDARFPSSSSRWPPCRPKVVARTACLCALSGRRGLGRGAALVHQGGWATQLTCVFVDTGLMRSGEADQVEDTFRRSSKMDLVHVKAADPLLRRAGRGDGPGASAKIIGELFIRIFRGGGPAISARGSDDVVAPGGGQHDRHRRGAAFLGAGARCTPTSSSGQRQPRHQVAPQCSAASRTISPSIWSSLSAAFKDEVMASARSSAACTRSCAPALSPGRDWGVRIIVRSHPSGPRSCETPMLWSSRRSAERPTTGSCGKSFAVLPAVARSA